jgi:hypothetical protein
MYDLIGDIHGHAAELTQLLHVLGYDQVQGVYRHPQRRAIFLGDFINRGPQVGDALAIVRAMIERGSALAVLGNHELNAVAFHVEDPEAPGQYLRRHTSKHKGQLRETIAQLRPDELQSYLDWFRTLPLWLDLDGLRVVHACWDERDIDTVHSALAEHGGITNSFLQAAYRPQSPVRAAIETILTGKDAKLPGGTVIADKDGGVRSVISARWYLPADGHTYRSYALQTRAIDCEHALEASVIAKAFPYAPKEKPVFVGHYWLSDERPSILAGNVACLDYSVAKGGFLCAYRWEGEQQLTDQHFVWVKAGSAR